MGSKQSSQSGASSLERSTEHRPIPSGSNGIVHSTRRNTFTLGSLNQHHQRQMYRHDLTNNDYAIFDPRVDRSHSQVESTGLQVSRRRGFEWLYENNNQDGDSSPDEEISASRMLTQTLGQSRPFQPHPPFLLHSMRRTDARCRICGKTVPADDIEVHFVMCLTKPRVSYNDDILSTACGECAICLEDLNEGETIARLPCLCVYHKNCIDQWFLKSQTCPEHPPD